MDILDRSDDTHWELKKSVARQLLSRHGIANARVVELKSNFERVKIYFHRISDAKKGPLARLFGGDDPSGPTEEYDVKRSEFVTEMELQASESI